MHISKLTRQSPPLPQSKKKESTYLRNKDPPQHRLHLPRQAQHTRTSNLHDHLLHLAGTSRILNHTTLLLQIERLKNNAFHDFFAAPLTKVYRIECERVGSVARAHGTSVSCYACFA